MRKGLITIVMVSLLLCLKGCIIVEPQVLNFESEIDILFLDVEPVLIPSWGVESTASWLTFYPPGGYTPDKLAVRVERSGLLPGTYTGELKISGEYEGLLRTTRVRVGMKVAEGWHGNIEGYVYDEDTGEEIEGARVTIYTPGAFFSTTTDFAGYYIFNLIDPNHEKTISVTKEGYHAYNSLLEPIGGITIQQDIYLQPKTSEEITTSSSSTTTAYTITTTIDDLSTSTTTTTDDLPSSTTTTTDDIPDSTTTTSGSSTTTTSVFVLPIRILQ